MMKKNICLFLGILCLFVLGCSGNNRSNIIGTVTIDGEPLPLAMIHFDPETPPEGVSVISGVAQVEKGSFKLEGELGLLPGKYKVWLMADLMKDKSGNIVSADDIKDMKVNPASLTSVNLIPTEYGQGGNNTFEVTKQKIIEYKLDIKTKK